MALMDAKEYDPRPAEKRRKIIATVVVVVIAVSVYFYFTRYDSEKKVINNFFQAIEQQDFDKAYGIYEGDPNWKQHPNKYTYTVDQFKLDWGPTGEYKTITSHRVDCVLEPPKKDASPSGVVVVVTINKSSAPRSMWVEKQSRTVTDSPVQVSCQGPK
jgi:hypothetical protein